MNDLTHQFTIETDIPPPTSLHWDRRRSPICDAIGTVAEGPIGGSVFIPNALFAKQKTKPIMRVTTKAWQKLGRGWFTCRTVEGGVRIWKMSEPKKAAA